MRDRRPVANRTLTRALILIKENLAHIGEQRVVPEDDFAAHPPAVEAFGLKMLPKQPMELPVVVDAVFVTWARPRRPACR
jgi:hypothetical protein